MEEDGLRFFQYQYGALLFLHSTKYGGERFLKKFQPVFLKQIHSDIIVDIDNETQRIGDGIITRKNRAIGVKIADCLPVYIFNEEIIGILHCGWRSIIKGILNRAIEIFKDYKYCLGASIGPCCYEIGEDVAKLFFEEYPAALIDKNSRTFLDLKKVVNETLGEKNLIGNLDYCTKCHLEYFFSYRRGESHKRNYAVVLKNYTQAIFSSRG